MNKLITIFEVDGFEIEIRKKIVLGFRVFGFRSGRADIGRVRYEKKG